MRLSELAGGSEARIEPVYPRLRRGRIVREAVEQHEVRVQLQHPGGLDSRGVIDDRRFVGLGAGEASGVQLEPAETVGSNAGMVALRLGACTLEQVIEIQRTVAREHHDHPEPPMDELADGRANPFVHEVGRKRERELHVQTSAREVHGRQYDASRACGGTQTEPVRLERVDAERQVRTVELKRADRNVGDRRFLHDGGKLGWVEPFVATLGHRGGGWKSSSVMPSWMRR